MSNTWYTCQVCSFRFNIVTEKERTPHCKNVFCFRCGSKDLRVIEKEELFKRIHFYKKTGGCHK